MLPLKPRRHSEVVGRWCSRSIQSSLSLRTEVCHLNTRTCVRLLGPCFKTGYRAPFPQPRHTPERQAVLRVTTTMSMTRAHAHLQVETNNMHAPNTDDLRFPLSDFRHSLTLFSKFFSSFLHSTCSLSVSHLYLALDGIYHHL